MHVAKSKLYCESLKKRRMHNASPSLADAMVPCVTANRSMRIHKKVPDLYSRTYSRVAMPLTWVFKLRVKYNR